MIVGAELSGLSKQFLVAGHTVKVLENCSVCFPGGQISVILGKSGCGKTTLIRMIAGLEPYDSGTLVAPPREKIGMVFQEPRLMPWLNTWSNIVFGMKKADIDHKAIAHVIELTNLTGFERAYPHQLSGGMQQRVAIARTLVYNPQMILMDEPFSALDCFLRQTMQNKLIEIYQGLKKSIVFVTHSVDEALLLGQKIVILGQGRVEKEYDLSALAYPRDPFSENLIAVKKEILQCLKLSAEC